MPDVIIVGAGPAGCSAAWVCSGAGLDTLLVSSSLDTVFHAEPDVQLSGTDADFAAAVLAGFQSLPQARELHSRAKWLLEQRPGLHLLQASVSEVLTEGGAVAGVGTWEGPRFDAPLVAVCAGSFLAARLTQGSLSEMAGKPSQMSYPELAGSLENLGAELSEVTRSFENSAGPGQVTSKVLTADGLEDGIWLGHTRGLAAAGYCVNPDLDFAGAATAGQVLGEALAAQALSVSATART